MSVPWRLAVSVVVGLICTSCLPDTISVSTQGAIVTKHDLFPFGPSEDLNWTAHDLDDKFIRFNLESKLGGQLMFSPHQGYSSVYISSNGLLSFGMEDTTYNTTAFSPTSTKTRIGVFWDDACLQTGSSVYYRVSTDLNQLVRSRSLISKFLTDRNIRAAFSPSHLVVVTWDNVAEYKSGCGASAKGRQERNTFQAVLAANSQTFYVLLLYPKTTIRWRNHDGKTGAGFEYSIVNSSFNLPCAGNFSCDQSSNVEMDGLWVLSPPLCGDPGLPQNSSRTFSEDVGNISVGSQVTYSCSVGHVLGKRERFCQENGTWTGSLPTCSTIQCFPKGQNGAFPDKAIAVYNEHIVYTCPIGHSFAPSDPTQRRRTAKCLANGTTSTLLQACVAVQCSPKSHNGAFPDKNSAVYKEAVVYTCPIGKIFNTITPTGRRIKVKCLANRTTPKFNHTCVDVQCSPKEQNGAIPEKSSAVYNETIVYTCPVGQIFNTINGTQREMKVKCLANGTTPRLNQTCVDVQCSPKEQNGAIPEKSSAVYNETIVYTCPVGQTFNTINGTQREMKVKCLANGTTPRLNQTCVERNECLHFPCHANARCENTPGSFLCKCKLGFLGDGFICTEVKCPHVKPVRFGSVQRDQTEGDRPKTFSFSCKSGFQFYPKAYKQIKCVHSHGKAIGEWRSVGSNEIVESIHQCIAPVKILQPKNDQVYLLTEGQSLNVPCTAKGYPYPQVTWSKTKEVVGYTKDLPRDINENYDTLPVISTTLEIQHIVPELSGNYSCRAFLSDPLQVPYIKSTEVGIQVVVSSVYLYALKLNFKAVSSQNNITAKDIVSAIKQTFNNSLGDIVLTNVQVVNYSLDGNTSHVELSVLHQGQPNDKKAKQITNAVWERRDNFHFAELLDDIASPIDKSVQLQKLSEQPVTNLSSAQKVVLSARQATAVASSQLSRADTERVTTILEKVNLVLQTNSLTKTSTDLKRQIVETSVKTVSNVLQGTRTQDFSPDLTSRIVPVLENIASVLPPQKNLSNGEADYGSVVTPQIALASLRFRKSSSNTSVALVFYKTNHSTGVQNGSQISGKRLRDEKLEAVPGDELKDKVHAEGQLGRKSFQTALKVSSNVVEFAKSSCQECWTNDSISDDSQQPAVILTLFEKTEFFTDKSLSSKGRTLASPVAAITVAGTAGTLTNLPENVSIHFPYIKTSKRSLTCVYWNYTGGNWMEEGCTGKHEIDTFVCSCNHLTNFALLLSEEAPTSEEEKLALKAFSYVGCGVSLLGLAGTIFLHLHEKRVRRSVRSQLVTALSANLLLLIAIFLAGVDETGNTDFCRAVSLLIHYFLLSTFCWMASSSYLLFIKLVLVVHAMARNFVTKAMIFSQGLPALVVIITAASDWEAYAPHKLCRLKYGTSFFVSLVTPLALLMAANILIFGFAMKNIIHRPSIGKAEPARKENKKFLKAAIKLFMALGLTWITGLIALIDAGTAPQWIFTIFVSFQGVFIFLLQMAVYNQEKQKHQRDSSGTRSTSVFGTLLRQARRLSPYSSASVRESRQKRHKHLPSCLKPKRSPMTIIGSDKIHSGDTSHQFLESESTTNKNISLSTVSPACACGEIQSTCPTRIQLEKSTISSPEVTIQAIPEAWGEPVTEIKEGDILEPANPSADVKKKAEE